MKNLAGGELEIRWVKAEHLVLGTWFLAIDHGVRSVNQKSRVDLRVNKPYQYEYKPKAGGPWINADNQLEGYWPIDDRYGPVLLGDPP